MAENGDRGGRRFKWGLRLAEVLLGLAESVGTQTEETLQEFQEREIFWGHKEAEEKGFESDAFGNVQSRSKNCRKKPTWSNMFPNGGKRLGELSAYQSYESAPVNVPHWPRSKISESFLESMTRTMKWS